METTKKNNKAATSVESTPAPAVETVATATEVVVTEEAPASIVPVAAAAPAVVKTRLFWQKTCHSLKESTNTEIKSDETFTRTGHKVMVLPEGSTEPVENLVYSMKRGKRIYYTPSSYLTPAQLEAADKAAEVKAAEKAESDKKKADEKAKKEAEKASKTAGQPKVVGGPAVVAAATEVATEEVTEENLA